MSHLAHLMCEACFVESGHLYEDVTLTDAHQGRLCCWCGKEVEFSFVVHRHPDAVPCKGIHVKEKQTCPKS